jgi:hypothetical protein
MRPRHFLSVLALFALCIGCSHEWKVVRGGPSVHDQLTGRGYITPPMDSLTPADSARLLNDTLQ